MAEIVKVQIPLFSTGDPKVLIYAEGRDRVVEANDLIPSAQEAMGHDIKGYFNATWDADDGVWHLHERVEDQAWQPPSMERRER